MALVLFLTGCAGKVQDHKDEDGVLIIYGEGLIPVYPDPTMSTLHFIASQRFSESLASEFRTLGITTTVYPHRDKTVQIQEYPPLLLARKKRDALVLVMFFHKKDDVENSLYMQVTYRPLSYQVEPSRVLIGGEVNKKYYMFSDGFDNSKVQVSTLAKNFVIHLEQTGNLPRARH